MPMIEFRYDAEVVFPSVAQALARILEEALRETLKEVCPHRLDYLISVEGDPFKIQLRQATLRVHVFYHEEWNFTTQELERLPELMKKHLTPEFQRRRFTGLVKLRFYLRPGHSSVSQHY